jgi:hypothetical protein
VSLLPNNVTCIDDATVPLRSEPGRERNSEVWRQSKLVSGGRLPESRGFRDMGLFPEASVTQRTLSLTP